MSASPAGHLSVTVRRQFYLDSVALMRISRTLCEQNGVLDAALMMATPANREIMQNAGLITADTGHLPDDVSAADLLLAVLADDEATALGALELATDLLDGPVAASAADGTTTVELPRSLRQAHQVLPSANLALVSVPGDFAAAEARKALHCGLNVMIFSDNVSLQAERDLKQLAREKQLLVMGPDCGTSIIGGVPLAFANGVPAGSIGLIGASGTGLQEVSCLLAQRQVGLSQVIGVGGRDLSEVVGGISTLQSLEWLARDQQTKSIAVISKPPAPEVMRELLLQLAALNKPTVACFIGLPESELATIAGEAPPQLSLVATLESAASALLALNGVTDLLDETAVASSAGSSLDDNQRSVIRGFFCGGTLCAEAQVVLHRAGQAIASNAAIPGVSAIAVSSPQSMPATSVLLDLGADEYTAGKPHPMIDPEIRSAWITQALQSHDCAALLLDCVIGYGAHADPARCIVTALQQSGQDLQNLSCPVLASVTGTELDPQVRSQQVRLLQDAGVRVYDTNAAAARAALQCVYSM